jgi:hypothetical protein
MFLSKVKLPIVAGLGAGSGLDCGRTEELVCERVEGSDAGVSDCAGQEFVCFGGESCWKMSAGESIPSS